MLKNSLFSIIFFIFFSSAFPFFFLPLNFLFLKEENKAKEGIKFVTCFLLLRVKQFKKEKTTNKKTKQNKMKQKEIKKEKGCGIGILQLLECLSFLFIYFHYY